MKLEPRYCESGGASVAGAANCTHVAALIKHSKNSTDTKKTTHIPSVLGMVAHRTMLAARGARAATARECGAGAALIDRSLDHD